MNTSASAVLADLAALSQEFDSPDWNSVKAVRVLYTHKHDQSAVTAICHAMQRLSEPDLMSTLMQMCHLIVVYELPEVEELLMARCQTSMNFALRMFFLLQAAMEDEIPELVYKTNRLWKQCELAAINAETLSPPRNRVCVENGSFKRISQLEPGRHSPSPRLARSNSFSNTLPTIPTYSNSSESLYASTSIIPPTPSVAISPIQQRIIAKSQSDAPQTQEEDNTVADLMEAANVNPEREEEEIKKEEEEEIRKEEEEKGKATAQINQLLAKTSISPSEPPPSLKTSTAPSPSFPSPSFSSSPPAPSLSDSSCLTSSIIQPSYASAVPSIDTLARRPSASASSSSSSHPTSSIPPTPSTDKAFGSSFFFKLRQLSGEGQSGHQRVYEYFYTELHMINSLFNISTALMSISLDGVHKLKEVRGRALQLLLTQINTQLIQSEQQPLPNSISPSNSTSSSISVFMDESLTYGVEIPVVPGWVIVKIHPEDSFCLSSRNRVPYMMLIEVLAFDAESNTGTFIENQPQHQTRYSNQPNDDESDSEDDWVLLTDDGTPKEGALKKGFIELWNEKEKRIRDTSPFSHLPGWRLAGVIVKAGDDLRQEQLASQLIFKIHGWFQAEKLPLFLRPYVVLATSSTTGLIECIPDTCSIDSLKKRLPNFGNLTNYFILAYGHKTSHKFIVAQTNFVESLAAYSLVTYLLQIKDRHNGNILLDVEGHLIHIDFGFMLNISPGNLGFEQAPFKLNQEMMELMGGVQSDMFKYFKTLLLSGFLEVRRHAEELVLLVEVMTTHSRMACFSRGGAQVIAGLRERLALDKNEEQCFGLVDTLVHNAMSSWTTQSYDSYQYYTNGIL